nr:uncharacterized protein LOC101242954 isoform X1 [Ciona intestinalis]|eukprot:XP_004225583.1 uncharacterized protein LOC101242954 isoform X1 [Ciona intestinalis]
MHFHPTIFLIVLAACCTEAVKYSVGKCDNNTSTTGVGKDACSTCVFQKHAPGRYCQGLKRCKIQFDVGTYSWTFVDDQTSSCQLDFTGIVSMAVMSDDGSPMRCLPGCCGVPMSQKQCEPKECVKDRGIIYIVQQQNGSVQCLGWGSQSCPEKPDGLAYCSDNTSDAAFFLKTIGATCIVYDVTLNIYVFRNKTTGASISKTQYINHLEHDHWIYYKSSCIAYLDKETLMNRNPTNSTLANLFKRKTYEISADVIDNCTFHQFENATSFFTMTSQRSEYICVQRWRMQGKESALCFESTAGPTKPDVETEFEEPKFQPMVLVISAVVVGTIIVAFVLYFIFPKCALQAKLFKETKKIDPRTEGAFSRVDLIKQLSSEVEKEVYESNLNVASTRPVTSVTTNCNPAADNRAPLLQAPAIYGAPAVDGSNDYSVTENGYSQKKHFLTWHDGGFVDAQDSSDSGITSAHSAAASSPEDEASDKSYGSQPFTPDSGVPCMRPQFEFDVLPQKFQPTEPCGATVVYTKVAEDQNTPLLVEGNKSPINVGSTETASTAKAFPGKLKENGRKEENVVCSSVLTGVYCSK